MQFRALAKEYVEKITLPGKTRHHKKFGDTQSDTIILLHIGEQKKVAPKDISQAMNVSTARIAVALNELEEKGLITRKIDEVDRRRIIVELTKKGQEYSKAQKEHLIDNVALFLTELGEDDAREYLRIMGRIAKIMQNKHSKQCNNYCITAERGKGQE